MLTQSFRSWLGVTNRAIIAIMNSRLICTSNSLTSSCIAASFISAPKRNSLFTQGLLASCIGVAAILDFPLHQLEIARVGNIQGSIGAGLLGEIHGQLGSLGPGEEAAGRIVGVYRLAGDPNLGARCGVLPGVGDQLFDLVVRRAGVLEDADLNPDLGGFAVLGDLLVELPPGCRFGVGPRLHHQAAGAIGSPHVLPAVGDVALGDILGHGTTYEAHRVFAGGLPLNSSARGEAEEDSGESKLHVCLVSRALGLWKSSEVRLLSLSSLLWVAWPPILILPPSIVNPQQ